MARNRLRVLRAEREITQVDLAIKAHIEPHRYWRIEKGYSVPSLKERGQLARAFGVDDAALGFDVPSVQERAS